MTTNRYEWIRRTRRSRNVSYCSHAYKIKNDYQLLPDSGRSLRIKLFVKTDETYVHVGSSTIPGRRYWTINNDLLVKYLSPQDETNEAVRETTGEATDGLLNTDWSTVNGRRKCERDRTRSEERGQYCCDALRAYDRRMIVHDVITSPAAADGRPQEDQRSHCLPAWTFF